VFHGSIVNSFRKRRAGVDGDLPHAKVFPQPADK
jgi:hypothetical protein